MNPNIIIYTTPDCGYCYTIKDYLYQKGLQFKEINIYEDDKFIEEMEKISNQKNVPVTVINDTVIVWWDKNKINKAILWEI